MVKSLPSCLWLFPLTLIAFSPIIITILNMLQRNNLSALHAHQDYLKQLLAQEDIFVVGGCIRDLLLGITTDPKDIDITMSSEPDTIRD